jgi:hypothetical protein
MFLSSSQGELILIIDVQSSVVRGSLVHKSPTASLPSVIYTRNVAIPYKVGSGSDYLIRMALQGVGEIVQAVRANLQAEQNAESLPRRVSAIHYVLSSPWVVSQAKTISMEFKEDTAISRAYITGMIWEERAKMTANAADDIRVIEEKVFDVRLNGYSVASWESKHTKELGISFVVSIAGGRMIDRFIEVVEGLVHRKDHVQFHSSLFLQHVGIQKVLPDSSDYALIHIHGELTDVAIIHGHSCSFFGSYPFGIQHIIRTIAQETNTTEDAARNMPCTSAMLLTGQTDTCLTFQYAPTPTQDLLALAFSYRTSTERAPELCVESEEGCINQFLRESVGPQTAWSRITQLMPLEGKRPQSIALLSDSENNPSPPDPAIHVSLVQYKDVVATQHTFLMERVATLPESTVENWPTILDEASRRGSSLELAFPLGPNSMMTQRNIWLENLSSPVTNCRSGQEGQTGSVQKTVRDTAAEYASQGHAIACTSLTYRDLSDVWGYVLHVVGQSLEGAGLHYTLLNPTTKRFDAEYTSGEHSIERYHPFLPSTHPIRKGSTVYTFTLTLESLSGETNRAIVDQVELIPLPLAWLRQIRTTVVDTKNDMQIAARMNNPTVVSNTSSWLTFVHSAVVDVHDTQGTQDTQNARGLVVLPQSFDQGWLGIPLYRWWEGSEHVIWNGWANGWLLPKGKKWQNNLLKKAN